MRDSDVEKATCLDRREAGYLKRGELLKTADGTEYYAFAMRRNHLEVARLVDGRPVVYAGALVSFILEPTPALTAAYPDWRAEPVFRTGFQLDGRYVRTPVVRDAVETAVHQLFDKLNVSAKPCDRSFGDSYKLFWHAVPATALEAGLAALNQSNTLGFSVDADCLPFATAYATNSYQYFSDFAAAELFMDLPVNAKERVVARELVLALAVLESREKCPLEEGVTALEKATQRINCEFDGNTLRTNL